MASRAKRLFAPLLLGSTTTSPSATIFTATSVRIVIKKLTATNATAVAYLVTIQLIIGGGTASATNTITYQKTVLAGQTVEFFEVENHVMENGDFLNAFCSTAAVVNLMGSGIETDV